MLRTIAFPNIKPQWNFDKILSKYFLQIVYKATLDNTGKMLNGPQLFFKARVRSGMFTNVD